MPRVTIHKALLAVVFAVLSYLASVTAAGPMGFAEWVNVVIALVSAVGVYVVPNTPEQPWLKMVVAILAAGLTVFASSVTDGVVEATEVIQIVLAGLAAAGVGTIANQVKDGDPVVAGGEDGLGRAL
jgi:hypothetical protein